MGLDATSARLLALTARLSDIEFEAQRIQSHKLALATQRDDLYEKYCDALDATKINVAYRSCLDGSINMIGANYNSVCAYNPYQCNQYVIKNANSGFVMVSQEVKTNYSEYGNDKYSFAWAMLGMENFNNNTSFTTSRDTGKAVGYNNKSQGNYGHLPYSDGDNVLHMTEAEYNVYSNAVASGDSDLKDYYDKISQGTNDEEKQKYLEEFRDYFYSKYKQEICNEMNSGNNVEWASLDEEFNYYLHLWDVINESGGCEAIESENLSGDKGDQWFNNMAKAGQITIHQLNNGKWQETNPATSINSNFLQEVQDDSDLKKAETEYKHDLEVINRKDTRFDTELSKLETERSALKTQIDSLKTVKKENIDRTFGIFS